MNILISIFRFFVSRRYKIEIKGIEVLKTSGAKLILPNHQALIDPQILVAYLWGHIKIVPVVTEGMYNIPILKSFFKRLNAVPVSDLGAGSRDTDVLKNITTSINHVLVDGGNVLLYPSGQIAGQGYEKIFNKKSAHVLVTDLPENTRVLAVRIRGLWGSMWSRAWIGKTPNLIITYLRAIWYIIVNLIFFCPKRKVYIEIEDITEYAKSLAVINRNSFNDGLEKFYNKYGEEPALFLKHYFFVPKLIRKLPIKIEGSVAELKTDDNDKKFTIPSDVVDKVLQIMKTEFQIPTTGITINSNFTIDLGIDSVTMVSLITEVETQFNVIAPDISRIKTIHDLCMIAMGISSVKKIMKVSHLHKLHTTPVRIAIECNETIPDLFIKTFKSNGNEPFVWDEMLGSSTRKQFYLKTMVLAEIIKKEIPSQYVGIMLPALQSTTLLVAAIYMAGKIPVMLNWTVGSQVLDYCIETTKLTHILTAGKFFDKIRDKLSDNVKNRCIMFETKVKEASHITKWKGILRTFVKPSISVSSEDVAVILFTSGSETLPKAVPLTHKNILSDMQSAFAHLELHSNLIFLSFLPPFHSFGFSVLTVTPLVTGMKVAYSPDPTAVRDIVETLKHTLANILVTTPTFLKMILAIAGNNDLKSLKLAVTGAESLQQSVIDEFKRKASPDAHIIEGYGITECSPILSLNTFEKQKHKSVGTFISTVEYLIVDYQNLEPLPFGKEGLLLVRGANIFKGYLDKNVASPFVTVNGKEYYKTGDLGYIDDDGYMFITGRLKRFIKIAGEMISLPAIEEKLLEKYGTVDEIALAVEGSDKIESPNIVLFCIFDIDKTEVNQYLRNSGFSNIVKIHKIVKIDKIPLLGTGKTDYKTLKSRVETVD